MAIKTVKASGGDWNSWINMCIGMRAFFPLSENYEIQFDGNTTWTIDDDFNNVFGYSGSGSLALSWNNKTISFTTNPTQLATPAKLVSSGSGAWRFCNSDATGTAKCNIKQLIAAPTWGPGYTQSSFIGMYGNPISGVGGHTDLTIENCVLICLDDNLITYIKQAACTLIINNSTIIFSHASPAINLGNNVLCANNLIVCYDSGAALAQFPGAGTKTKINNTLYNYGGGTVAFDVAGTGDILNQNPNCVNALLVGGDTRAQVLARSAALTASSTPCLNNADVATAAATDITGKVRG